jgi:hypothetical protein
MTATGLIVKVERMKSNGQEHPGNPARGEDLSAIERRR